MRIIPVGKTYISKAVNKVEKAARKAFSESKDAYKMYFCVPEENKVFNRKFKNAKKLFKKLNKNAIDFSELYCGLSGIRYKKDGKLFSGITKMVEKNSLGTHYEFKKVKSGQVGIDDFKSRIAFYFEKDLLFPFFERLNTARFYNTKTWNVSKLSKTIHGKSYFSSTTGKDGKAIVKRFEIPRTKFQSYFLA